MKEDKENINEKNIQEIFKKDIKKARGMESLME